jgi:uncharacterized protein (TIGR02646 family)
VRIVRGLDPGPFSKYTQYKASLRPCFRSRCAYCLVPDDRLGGVEGMTVDHFKPRDRYPELLLVWTNLYYSCPVCNEHYKKNHPTAEEEALGLGLVDPCAHDPEMHFRLMPEKGTGHHCVVRGRTSRGRYTTQILKFNYRPFLRDFWRELELLDRAAREDLRIAEALIRAARRQLRAEPANAEFKEMLSHIEGERTKIQEKLVEIAGRRPFPLHRPI